MTTNIKKVSDNSFIVEICGRFSADAAQDFLKAVDPLTKESRADIVLDLGGLDFISSAGLRCFVILLKASEANGSSLHLRNLSPTILDIFSLTALIDKFVIE